MVGKDGQPGQLLPNTGDDACLPSSGCNQADFSSTSVFLHFLAQPERTTSEKMTIVLYSVVSDANKFSSSVNLGIYITDRPTLVGRKERLGEFVQRLIPPPHIHTQMPFACIVIFFL